MSTPPPKTRVLWLTKGLGPGGAERLLLNFARRADRTRFELHAAYLLPWKDHLVAELTDAGVQVHGLDAPRPWIPTWVPALRRLVAEHRIDVVHGHSPLVNAFARPALKAMTARRRPGLVTTEHNVWSSHQPGTRLLNQITMRLDDHVWAVSEEVRASMGGSARRRPDRVEVLTHGVDVEAIKARRDERPAARARLGLTDDEPVVVTVANLRQNKDYPTMLAAARLLVDRRIDVTFLSVGQGPLEVELAAERDRLGLGDRFRFLGYQPDPIGVMVAGDVFCLSSRYEGLPIALLEALAVGLPVVATAVGGVPGLLGGAAGAELVAPGDPDALASALADRLAATALEGVIPASVDIGAAVEAQQDRYEQLARRARGADSGT